jgi:TPR repeat protein
MFRLILLITALSFASTAGATEESDFFAEMQVLADQGHAIAQYFVGDAYSNGKGVLKDSKEAVKWYRLAADQGDADAQFSLGGAYFNGEGIGKDLVLAYMWINLAADNGKVGAVETRDTLAQLMTPAQIRQAQRMAK